jgi:hypothetical protein
MCLLLQVEPTRMGPIERGQTHGLLENTKYVQHAYTEDHEIW